MRKAKLPLIVFAIGVLAVALTVGVFYLGSMNNDSSPTPTLAVTSTLGVSPTAIMTTAPTSNPPATPTSGLTVTYLEQSRNQTMIVIHFKLEPNSYIFQMNATSFILTEEGTRVSANANDAVIIGTQYSTMYFPIDGYSDTDYHLSSDVLPQDTVWIKQ